MQSHVRTKIGESGSCSLDEHWNIEKEGFFSTAEK